MTGTFVLGRFGGHLKISIMSRYLVKAIPYLHPFQPVYLGGYTMWLYFLFPVIIHSAKFWIIYPFKCTR